MNVRHLIHVVSIVVLAVAILDRAVELERSRGEIDDERRALISKVSPGMTEDEVIRKLGKPFEVQSPETGQQRCRVDGYSHTERTISNRCLVYFGAYEAIAYVYIDRNGRVEDVFVGGS